MSELRRLSEAQKIKPNTTYGVCDKCAETFIVDTNEEYPKCPNGCVSSYGDTLNPKPHLLRTCKARGEAYLIQKRAGRWHTGD